MARSPPPAAIDPSTAALTGSTMTSQQSSDLPLRNYRSPSEPADEPGHGLSHLLPVTSHPVPPPETPSSVAAEYGDANRDAAPSAAAITNNLIQSYSRFRSRSGPSDASPVGVRTARSNSPAPGRSHSESRPHSVQRGELSPASQDVNEKVQRFLRSMSPPNPMDELAKENRSLHQRIAALQRTERDLLNDNQELARRLASNQKRHDTRRQHWKEELVNREKVFEARIKALESRLARQEEELVRIASDRSRDTVLNDNIISSWFTSKAKTWRVWADDFAHRDSERLQSGLHPLQLRDICDGVRHFVRLTDKGDLPGELLASAGNHGTRAVRLLLQGMLTNFIISETLSSPFWVFDAVSENSLEPESPSVPRFNSVSPVGFRMDLAMWNFSAAPLGDVRSPRPMVLPLESLAEPQDTRKLPRLVTAIQPPSVSTDSAPGSLDQDAPSRQAMESLYRLSSKMRGGDSSAIAWRNSLMKSFVEGGMSMEADSILHTDESRHLAEARLRYAGRLKDKFLRGPARFLLRDQDSAGIEKLERRLVQEIDATLRFSCQLWCRNDTPQVRGLHDLLETTFTASRDDIELCHAQTPHHAQSSRGANGGDSPPGYHDGHSVIMVVQPSVGVRTSSGTRQGAKANTKVNTKVWTKASVLVATPQLPAQTSTGTQSNGSPDASSAKAAPNSASVKATVDTPSSASPPSSASTPPAVPPKDAKESGLTLLPNIAFKNFSAHGLEAPTREVSFWVFKTTTVEFEYLIMFCLSKCNGLCPRWASVTLRQP
ncbi:hypothetical protein N658DRAFT_483352 [Parathielavia hyrcaniae]|uniref:Uncharacterized protein n=1 Tax=Parathielavia hyrcaniae TaxID=113614 RepID=A0AAN6QBF7_9PEZI|nr:hypothetical protein N658DRAFT_483352 [Parathielavia hyrcaniae]